MRSVLPQTGFDTVELRRYAMRPGRRDDLIALFESAFIEGQEACGMVPVGHFRDAGDPNAFVWFRAFARMETRADALEAFYTSKTWLDRRDAANATLLDSDDVLLLRSARPESGFDTRGLSRPAAAVEPASRVIVSVLMLDRPADETLLTAFEDGVLPTLRSVAERVAWFVTDDRPNDFPRLPVRENEYALVVTGVCRASTAEGTSPTAPPETWTQTIADWQPTTTTSILSRETLNLEPALRSLLR